MRKIQLSADDFEMFDREVGPGEYEFFKHHNGAFKRMWSEQGSQFWIKFIMTFRAFSTEHGFVKGYSGKKETYSEFLDSGFIYIHEQFVDGPVGRSRELIHDIVVISQTRSLLQFLQSKSVTKDPFYRKETKESYRKLYGPPNEKSSYLKAFCLYPLFTKFAGGVCICLKRWINAATIDSDDESWWTPPSIPSAVTNLAADLDIADDIDPSPEDKAEFAYIEEEISKLRPIHRARFVGELPKEGFGVYMYYMRELFNPDSTGPCFAAGWETNLDPRFNVPCNTLFRPTSKSNNWQHSLTFTTYCRFLLYLSNHRPSQRQKELQKKRLSIHVKKYIWKKLHEFLNQKTKSPLIADDIREEFSEILENPDADLSDNFDVELLRRLAVDEFDPYLNENYSGCPMQHVPHIHICNMDAARSKKRRAKNKKAVSSIAVPNPDRNPPQVIDMLCNDGGKDVLKKFTEQTTKKDTSFVRIIRWRGDIEIQEMEESASKLPTMPASIQYVCQGRDVLKPLLVPDEMPSTLTLLVIPHVVVERCAKAAGSTETMLLDISEKSSQYYTRLEKLFKSEYSGLLAYSDTKSSDYRVNPVFYDPATHGCLVQGVTNHAEFAIHVMDTINGRNDRVGNSLKDMITLNKIESKLPWFPSAPVPGYSEPRRPIEKAPPIFEGDKLSRMCDRSLMIFSLIFPNESGRTSVRKGMDQMLYGKPSSSGDDPDYWDFEQIKTKYEGSAKPKQAMQYEHRRRRLLKKLEQRKSQHGEGQQVESLEDQACGVAGEDYKPAVTKMRIVNDELRKIVHLMQLSRQDDKSDTVEIMKVVRSSPDYRDALELESYDATSLRPGLVAHHFVKKKLFHSECLGMPNLAMVAEARHMYYWEQFSEKAPSNSCKKSAIRQWYECQEYEDDLDILEAMVSEVIKAPELYSDLPSLRSTNGKPPKEPVIPKIPMPENVEKLSRMDPLIALIDLKMTKAFLDRVRHVTEEDALKAMDQLIDMPMDIKKLCDNMYIFEAVRKVRLMAKNEQAVEKALTILDKIEKIQRNDGQESDKKKKKKEKAKEKKAKEKEKTVEKETEKGVKQKD